ncbi:MAG TPA: dual specificity protein phosphatase family protein [bacterium]|nr:dual specificity protein phosphatase family protein [bacterium]
MGDASRILPSLYIGSAPASEADLKELRREVALTALLSLQTDADLAVRNLSWEREAGWCRALGIEAHRLPIEDWSAQDVIAHLDEGVEALRRLLEDGQVVYLHCTAGVNRSPSIALGYLVRVGGQPIEDALVQLQQARPGARPYPDVLEVLRGDVPR